MRYLIVPQVTGQGGYKEHWALQEKYAGTKSGQLDLAQKEAEQYEDRYETLRREIQNRARAYDAAVEEFGRFVEGRAPVEDRLDDQP